MESDLEQQQQAHVNSSGLTRYRSAPSSYFNNIIDREFYEHVFNRPSSPETERVFSRFMNSFGSGTAEEDSLVQQKISSAVKEEEVVNINQQQQNQNQAMPSINNNEHMVLQQSDNNSASSSSHGFYQMPPLPNQNLSSIGVVNRLQQMKTSGGGNNSNLIRHNSSPAGFFSQINIENGYVSMRGMGTLGAVNNSMEEAKFPPVRRMKNQSNYSPGIMSSIAEIGDKSNNRENNSDNDDIITDYQAGHWDDTEMMSENVSGVKRYRDHDHAKPFSAAAQNETGGQTHSPLAHQLSMPNTSSEMAAIETFLHFSDAVPCKIRAKRGCATHPRSIAERVRRTKISDRMKRLQDLVPNMDKQTNTSDMLDLAVDYIKDLQKQVQTVKQSVSVHTRSNNNGKDGDTREAPSDLECTFILDFETQNLVYKI